MVAKSNDIKSVQALRIMYIVFWLPNSLPCRPTDTEARIVKIKANGFIVFVPKYGSLPSNLLCGLNVMPFVVFTPFSNQVRHRRAHLPYSKGRQRWWLGSRRGAPESNQARNKHQLCCPPDCQDSYGSSWTSASSPKAATHPHMKNVQLNCNISVFPASYTSSPFFNSTLVWFSICNTNHMVRIL